MGGPSQHSTWDPKPEAPAEIRGEFGPISTSVPGLQLSELFPRDGATGPPHLRLAGRVERRQRPLVERLLHAHGPAAYADELRERQSRSAERFSQLGGGRPPLEPDPRPDSFVDHAAAPYLQHRRQRLARAGCRISRSDGRPLDRELCAGRQIVPHSGACRCRRTCPPCVCPAGSRS